MTDIVLKDNFKHEMYRAMVALLGRGYTPEYYEDAATDFILIAEAAIADDRRHREEPSA